jgi:hypothetical protein
MWGRRFFPRFTELENYPPSAGAGGHGQVAQASNTAVQSVSFWGISSKPWRKQCRMS